MNGAGVMMDAQKRMQQNKSLLQKRVSYKEIHEVYGKTPYDDKYKQPDNRFSPAQIEAAKQRARASAKRDNLISWRLQALTLVIVILLFLAFWYV